MKETLRKEKIRSAFSVEYGAPLDAFFRIVSEQQLKDRALWSLLVKQFEEKSDVSDSGWRGEFWGKLMRGASMIYAYSNEKELYSVLAETAEELLKTQDEFGRITTYTLEKEFCGWDMWCRKYVMLGLEYFYGVCTDGALKKRIVAALCNQADYIMSKVGDGKGKISVYETSSAWGAMNSVSIIQPFVRFYEITEDKKYLEYAEMLIRSEPADMPNIFELAFKSEKAPFEYPVTKAYEIISCFEGLLDYYKITGEEKCIKACINFADKILETDFTLIGASGCRDEYFDNSSKIQFAKSEIHKQETCVTVTLMKFFAAMYECTDESKYIDAVETSLWNAYLGALNDVKNEGYLARPLFYSYSPIYDNPRWTLMGGKKNISSYAVCGCCVSIAAAGLGVLPSIGAEENNGCVTLNFFYDGKYRLKNEFAFDIESEYPYDGRIMIVVSKAEKPFKFRIRKPLWCEKFTVTKNGAAVRYKTEGGYIVLCDTVEADDRILFDIEMPFRIISSKSLGVSYENMFAVAKGPVIYCADSKDTDVEKVYKIKRDEQGYAVVEKNDKIKCTVLTEDGKLPLTEYKSAGKDYYEPRKISVWLHVEE